jgi:hypothetical protein
VLQAFDQLSRHLLRGWLLPPLLLLLLRRWCLQLQSLIHDLQLQARLHIWQGRHKLHRRLRVRCCCCWRL